MPSDANGIYSLPPGYLATTGTTIQASQHNPPLEDIADAISNRLPRSGAAPMLGPFKVVDGAPAMPSVAFTNAPTTGLYKTANGIGIAVNGVQVVEVTAGGFTKGGRFIGELIPVTTSTVKPLTVFPYGQTLSRSAYPDLWTLAQTEITAGNTFYNNGDGSSTFGIGDLRGRVVAGRDDMGGTAAGRFANVTFSAGSATVLGSTVGAAAQPIAVANLPPHPHTGTTGGMNANKVHNHTQKSLVFGLATYGLTNGGNGYGNNYIGDLTTDKDLEHGHDITTAGTPGATNAPFSTTQPTLICNYLLFAGA